MHNIHRIFTSSPSRSKLSQSIKLAFAVFFLFSLFAAPSGCGGAQCNSRDSSVALLRIANFSEITPRLDASFGSQSIADDVQLAEASCFESVQMGQASLTVTAQGKPTPFFTTLVTPSTAVAKTLVVWGTEAEPHSVLVSTGQTASDRVSYTVVNASTQAGPFKVYVAAPGVAPTSGNTPLPTFVQILTDTERVSGTIDCLPGAKIAYLVQPGTNTVLAQSEVCPNIGDRVEMIVVFKDGPKGGLQSAFFTQACEGPLRILTDTLPQWPVNVTYAESIAVTGGTGFGYDFAIQNGALPPGLVMSADGQISGTATQVGSFNFTVSVSDSSGFTVTKDLAITITGASVGEKSRFFNAATNSANATLSGTWKSILLGGQVSYGNMGTYVVTPTGSGSVVAKRTNGTTVGTSSRSVPAGSDAIFVALGNDPTGVPIVVLTKTVGYDPGPVSMSIRLVNGLSEVPFNVDFYILPHNAPVSGFANVTNSAYQQTDLIELGNSDFDLVCTQTANPSFVLFRTNIGPAIGGSQYIAVAVSPNGLPGSFLIRQDN